jgi:hypothetical protein
LALITFFRALKLAEHARRGVHLFTLRQLSL